jgi:hypothetical protein
MTHSWICLVPHIRLPLVDVGVLLSHFRKTLMAQYLRAQRGIQRLATGAQHKSRGGFANGFE